MPRFEGPAAPGMRRALTARVAPHPAVVASSSPCGSRRESRPRAGGWGGDGQTLASDAGQLRLAAAYSSRVLSAQGRKNPPATQSLAGVALGHREPAGAGEAGFVCSRGWAAPWFPREDALGLFE